MKKEELDKLEMLTPYDEPRERTEANLNAIDPTDKRQKMIGVSPKIWNDLKAIRWNERETTLSNVIKGLIELYWANLMKEKKEREGDL
jgi:hypothetical protein